MVSPILFAGGEDINFTPIATSIDSAVGTTAGRFGIDTTANGARTGYGRYCLCVPSNGASGGFNAPLTTNYLRTNPLFSSSSFWFSARVNNRAGAANPNAMLPLRFVDSNGVVRLTLTFS